MALTVELIQGTTDDKELLQLLCGELNRLLPKEVLKNRELYFETLGSLPSGLRAMAGMHFFDVSMAIDDLAWHFGNQYDESALCETLNGLRELELDEVADLFEQARRHMSPYIEAKQKNSPLKWDPMEWSQRKGVDKAIWAMDRRVREVIKSLGSSGLLARWPIYARKYPERCVVVEA